MLTWTSIPAWGWTLPVVDELKRLLDDTGVDWAYLRESGITAREADACTEVDLWCGLAAMGELCSRLLLDGWMVAGGRYLPRSDGAARHITVRLEKPGQALPQLEITAGALRWLAVVYLDEASVTESIVQDARGSFISGATDCRRQ